MSKDAYVCAIVTCIHMLITDITVEGKNIQQGRFLKTVYGYVPWLIKVP